MIDLQGIKAIEKLNDQVRELKIQLKSKKYSKRNEKTYRMNKLDIILRSTIDGRTLKDISCLLETSEKTVCRYLAEIRETENLVDNRAAANQPSLYKIIEC